MVRETSVEAYRKIKENGLLSTKRMEVYDILYEYGPLTGMELLMKRRVVLGKKSAVDSQVRARLNELRACGVAEEVKTVECSVTGQRVILWDVTPFLPVKMDKARRHKCKICKGTGYVLEQQIKLF